MITYQYAQSDDGTAINIADVTDEYRKQHQFICFGCGNRMSAVLGKKRDAHFRHFHDCDCSKETYLHHLGKKMFVELYANNRQKGLPLYVDYLQNKRCKASKCPYGRNIICARAFKYHEFELLPRYNNYKVEEFDADAGLRPDILLTDDAGNKIYIEIAVTHESTEKKINSRIPIVEFYFSDESDLDVFRFNEDEPKISLGHDFSDCINFDDFSVESEPFCYDDIKRAKISFKQFYYTYLNFDMYHGPYLRLPCATVCEKKCRFLEKGKCHCDRDFVEYDLTKYFKNYIDEDEQSSDLYLISEKGARIRVNFSIWLSDDGFFPENERVIQFALGVDGNYYAWKYSDEIAENESVKFFNFKKITGPNCEEQWFEGAVLYKSGRCVPLIGKNIKQILEMYAERRDSISDYVIFPSDIIHPDAWLGAPATWTSKEAYKAIAAMFLKNGMWVKNCNLCTFCKENWKRNDEKPIYCYRLRKTCRAGDAVNCNDYQISDENVNVLTSDERLMEVLEEAWKNYRLK